MEYEKPRPYVIRWLSGYTQNQRIAWGYTMDEAVRTTELTHEYTLGTTQAFKLLLIGPVVTAADRKLLREEEGRIAMEVLEGK